MGSQVENKNMIGNFFKTNEGCIFEIIEYNNACDILIKFCDNHNYETKVRLVSIKKGTIKNPYFNSIFGIAHIGETTVSKNKVIKRSYGVWHSIMQRCYSDIYMKQNMAYIGCSVCDEWLCYEIFEKWYDKNYYEINNEVMCLDKDILSKGNKIYSPETCCFVPNRINVLFTNRKNHRGMYPIGVHKPYNKNRFYSICNCYDEYEVNG